MLLLKFGFQICVPHNLGFGCWWLYKQSLHPHRLLYRCGYRWLSVWWFVCYWIALFMAAFEGQRRLLVENMIRRFFIPFVLLNIFVSHVRHMNSQTYFL